MKFMLRGGEEALANLRRLREAVSPPYMQAAAIEALQPVVADARDLAPVEDGDLRDSIGVKVLEDGSVAVVIGDWKGHFFEFGTVKMRAQPMLIPAWDANEELVIARFGRAVAVNIERPYSRGGNSLRAGLRFEGDA